MWTLEPASGQQESECILWWRSSPSPCLKVSTCLPEAHSISAFDPLVHVLMPIGFQQALLFSSTVALMYVWHCVLPTARVRGAMVLMQTRMLLSSVNMDCGA